MLKRSNASGGMKEDQRAGVRQEMDMERFRRKFKRLRGKRMKIDRTSQRRGGERKDEDFYNKWGEVLDDAEEFVGHAVLDNDGGRHRKVKIHVTC